MYNTRIVLVFLEKCFTKIKYINIRKKNEDLLSNFSSCIFTVVYESANLKIGFFIDHNIILFHNS